MPEQNYYQILEIPFNSAQEEIEAAYKRLAKKYHPDFFHGNDKRIYADELMKRLNEAYNTLKDPIKREKYNQSFIKIKRNRQINLSILGISSFLTTITAIITYINYNKNLSLTSETDYLPFLILIALAIFTIYYLIITIISFKKGN